MTQLHPYLWSYGPAIDEILGDLAIFACRSLVGRPPRYGDPRMSGNPARRFAIAVPREDYSDREGPDAAAMVERLRACGAGEIPVYQYSTIAANSDAQGRAADQASVGDMKLRGVTTVIVLGHGAGGASLMQMASSSDYRPEWVAPGTRTQQQEASWNLAPADQMAGLFGLGTANKGVLPQEDRPARWAYREEGGEGSPDGQMEDAYRELLLLASGIQAAGPNLTPHTFASGLQSLRFPNTGAGRPPYWQATVGFSGDHTMVDDLALVWWSSAVQAYYGTAPYGSWCYVDQGARWRSDTWPKREHAFFDRTKPCR